MFDLENLSNEAEEASNAASTLEDLTQVQTQFLGKKSKLVEAKKALGTLPAEDRANVGKEINEIKGQIEQLISGRKSALQESEWISKFNKERMDLTERLRPIDRGHLHLITQARDELEDVFIGMGYSVAEGPEVETAWYNFEALNIPDWHPARGNFDTIFVDLGEPEEVMLRSHTSPVQIRTMESQEPPIYIVAPGRTFRTDSADATHLPAFNQIEGLVIDKGITMGDLAGTIDSFVHAFFGEEVKSRLRPSYFPFTEPSAEFDISRSDGSWLELGGCGMVHPNVLRNCNIDPEVWQGFAFGFGIDRLVSMRYQLDDIGNSL